jgi:cobalt/nickel transport system permease protein
MHHAHIDKFAYQDSPVHRLDARVKFIATVIFTAFVISLPRTSFAILFCYAIGPFVILVLGRIPIKFVFKHILFVSPFVLVLALSCPLYDKTPVKIAFGPSVFQATVGWERCGTICGKFVVTMLALIALVSTTRFSNLLAGLGKLGVPKLLIIQLGFLYRYIFVLIDTAQHILRARAGRTFRNLGVKQEMKIASAMLGSLFIGSIDTAERINIAMHGRGFDGNWRTISRLKISSNDYIFGVFFSIFVISLYFFAAPAMN